MIKKLTILFALLVFLSCSDKKAEHTVSEDNSTKLFSFLAPESTGINFKNTITNSEELNIFKYRNFYNGGGVAIGDINNDGLPDIYFTANMNKNKLYLNQGDFKFKEITETANVAGTNTWSTGVVMVDINNDNLLDIYVCNAGNINGDDRKNELYINNGDLTFTEQAKKYNLAESGLTTHAAFFDYDKDGDLDAYILNNSFIPVSSLNYSNKRDLRDNDWNVPKLLKGGGDKLLRNDNGIFTDVSEAAGIYGSLIGFGLGVTVGDVNTDGYPDIYISNDFYERDYLYINNKNGTFSEEIKDWTQHISQSSMGADMADINNDGLLDIFVTDMLPESDKRLKETTQFENYNVYQRKQGLDFYHQYMQNSLQLNLGNNKFSEIANLSGVSRTDWSWGALLFDMDNDGYKDIFVCNGIYQDLTNQDFMNFFANDIIQNMVINGKREEISEIFKKMPSTAIPNYAFKNNADLSFSNNTQDWGLAQPSFSNGASYADLDNDGDLDLVINNVNQDAFIYKNNTESLTKNSFLKVKLVGNESNTLGVGSTIIAYAGEEKLVNEVIPSRGFQSSTDYIQTIGIGTRKIDSLTVKWANGNHETIKNIASNQLYTFKNEASAITKNTKEKPSESYFKQVPIAIETHKENLFNDFDYEGLIQQKISAEGPTIAIADVNNDGLDDVFIGNAKNQPSQIYIQKSSGKFTAKSSESLQKQKHLEDTASAFADIDNDGDVDLIIGSGGNEIADENISKINIYNNDGKGNFSLAKNQPQENNQNIAVIQPYDFDADGDVDIFIGTRSVPSIYGINPEHMLLENDGNGNFKNVIENRAYDVKDIGMITDAAWADMNADGKKDLVIVSDWGNPTVFINSGRRLKASTTSLDNLKGWWNTITIADVNNDNRPDFILGNKGENSAYLPSENNPIKIYINDFDANGTIEQIRTRTINGKDYPIVTKHELTQQIVSLKKENIKFSEYAQKTIQELFPEAILSQSIVKEVNTSQSVVAINLGENNFKVLSLPKKVQFSSVNAITVLDVNQDNHLDLILGGNEFTYKPQYIRLDASYGHTLLGDSSGAFQWQNYDQSGLFVEGEIKTIQPIQIGKSNHMLIGINNKVPALYRITDDK